ncbi:MAG: TldD/PmbA family protein [Nanoarchaeota archaeon]
MIEKVESYIKKKGIEEYEVFYESSEKTRVILQRDNIDFLSKGYVDGIGIRVCIDKKLGFSSTIDLKNYEKCVDEAIKIAKLNNKDEKFVKFNDTKIKSKNKIFYDKKLMSKDIEYMNKYIKDYMKIVKDTDKEIKLNGGGFEKSTRTKKIINSEGINLESTNCNNTFWCELMKSKENTLGFGEMEKTLLKPEKAKEHIKRLLECENKNTPETQNINLVLHPEAFSELLGEIFLDAIDAESVQSKKSILQDKLNKKIFHKDITIIDDSLSKNLIFSREFDDEGTASRKTSLVEKGVLKNFLYDTYHANIDKVKSTSSASRSYSSTPSISTTNVLMKTGNKTEEKILNSVDKLIYVKNLIGTHTVDSTTGDFSLGVMEGHIYEKGEMKYAVKDTMIAGNFYKMMNDIISIGNKQIHTGGTYFPIVLLGKVKMIGK